MRSGSRPTPSRASLSLRTSPLTRNTTRVTPRLTVTYGLRWELNPPPRERKGRDPVVLTGLEERGSALPSSSSAGACRRREWTLRSTSRRAARRSGTLPARTSPRARGSPIFSRRRAARRCAAASASSTTWAGTGRASLRQRLPVHEREGAHDVTFPLDPTQAEPPPVNLDPPFGTVYAFVPDLKLPLTFQWSATVEHPLGASQVVSASYVGALGRRLLRQTALVRPDPRFTLVRLTSNTSASDYHALQFQFARRLSRGLQAHASYTWARATDDDSDDSSRLLFTGIFERERAPANFDVRHSLVAAATYNLPKPLRSSVVAPSRAAGPRRESSARDTATPVNVF